MYKRILLAIILILLLLVSLFPRSIDVLNQNPVFITDQGRDYMAAKSIIVDHKLTLLGAELGAGQAGLQYLFHGPGYFYLISLAFILFNGNPVGGVFFMLLFGLSSIAFGTYFVTKIFGLKEGIFMGFLVALCPFFIGQSRLMENHFASVVFIMIIFYLIFLFTKEKKSKYLFFAAFTSAAIYNLEFALAVPLSITLILYSIIILRKKIFNKIPLLLLGFFAGFLPMVIFELRHGFMGIKGLITYLFTKHEVTTVSPPISKHISNMFNLFVYSFSDSFPGHLVLPAIFVLTIFTILFLFIFYKEKSNIFKNFFLYIFLLYPVNFFVFLFLRNIVFLHYIIDLYIANMLITVYIISRLYQYKYKLLSSILFIYLIILFVLGSVNAYKVSLHDYSDYGGVNKLKAKLDAVDFIYNDAKGKPFGIFVFVPPVYSYQYDYIIWWRGDKKYHYQPTQDKSGTFYLIIEKDEQKPWTYIGWEKTVIKSGKVIFTKTMPESGLIVEKREGNSADNTIK